MTTYKRIELDEIKDGSRYQDALEEISGQRTVPNIFIGKQHLGGYDDTMAAYKSGKIGTMLSIARVPRGKL